MRADASAKSGGGAGALFVSTPLQRLRQEEKALAQAARVAQGLVGGDDDDSDDEAYEGPSSQELAQTTLDQIALHVPHKWSLEPSLGLAFQCLDAPDDSTRRAGAAAVGVVAEGFQDPLREHHLGSVLAKLAQAAQKATDAPTRECLCFAYGQLAEHCQPEIIGHSNAVIPVVFEFLNDQRAAVRRGVPSTTMASGPSEGLRDQETTHLRPAGRRHRVLRPRDVLRVDGLRPVAALVRAAHV